jgi:hypothetical protein
VKKPSRDPGALPPDNPEAIAARLEEMERKIDRLRSMYESFFAGTERRPPNVPRRELNRLILEMQQIQIHNAALRFRFQSLTQKWVLLTTYWNRTLREIETGMYRKDLARVSRRLAEKGAPLSEGEAIALGIPAARARALVARQSGATARAGGDAAARPGGDAAVRQAADSTPAMAARGEAPARPPGVPAVPAPAGRDDGGALAALGMGEADVADLHRRYEAAARSIDRPGPSLDKLKQLLARRAAELAAAPGAGALRFDVAVKDGRVVLRAGRRG